jgi:hypothetical protein
LLWTADCGKKILDYVYPNDGGSHINSIKNWCKENQVIYYPDNHGTYFVTWTKKVRTLPFPYMDSFRWWNPVTSRRVILSTQSGNGFRCGGNTQGGSPYREKLKRCDECGEMTFLFGKLCLSCKIGNY